MKRPLRVAAVQIAAADLEFHAETLGHSLELIKTAAARGVDLVVLPECTYPAYFLVTPTRPRELGVLGGAEAVDRYAAKAAECRVHVAVGLAYLEEDGSITNSAVLIDSDGRVVGRYAKSFLWHFDNEWFRCGRDYPVFDTAIGRIGMFICADGRQPEIARAICLQEPDLVLDLTAWVSWGRRRPALSSTQPDHLLPARAIENGAWIAAASKVGEEASSILYCGSSCLVSPQGEIVERASSDKEEVLVWDIPLERPARPRFERRPELYDTLTRPTHSLPVTALANEPARLDDPVMVAATQFPSPTSADDLLDRIRSLLQALRPQGVKLLVLPAADPALSSDFTADTMLPEIHKLVEPSEILALTLAELVDGAFYRTAYVVSGGRILAAHRQTHGGVHTDPAGIRLGDQRSPVIDTPIGRLAVMVGAEGFVPEVARCLMLEGAEIIAWSAFEPPVPLVTFAQTRSEENRLFVAAAAASVPNGGAVISDPEGRVLATAPTDAAITVSALITPALARRKQRAPGTDVVLSRQPETYRSLAEPLAVRL